MNWNKIICIIGSQCVQTEGYITVALCLRALHAFHQSFTNTQTLKFKTQPTIAFLTSIKTTTNQRTPKKRNRQNGSKSTSHNSPCTACDLLNLLKWTSISWGVCLDDWRQQRELTEQSLHLIERHSKKLQKHSLQFNTPILIFAKTLSQIKIKKSQGA